MGRDKLGIPLSKSARHSDGTASGLEVLVEQGRARNRRSARRRRACSSCVVPESDCPALVKRVVREDLQRRAGDEADPDHREGDRDHPRLLRSSRSRSARGSARRAPGGRAGRRARGADEDRDRGEQAATASEGGVRSRTTTSRCDSIATRVSDAVESRVPSAAAARSRAVRFCHGRQRVVVRVDAARLGADRVPDDSREIHNRNLQDHHHEDSSQAPFDIHGVTTRRHESVREISRFREDISDTIGTVAHMTD